MPDNPVLWKPEESHIRGTHMFRFMEAAGHDTYDSLYAWSLDDRDNPPGEEIGGAV